MRHETWSRWFRKNQNGFTLVELIVTLAIFAIVLVVAGNYLFFGNNLFAKTAVKNNEKYIGDNALEYMQKRLTYAVKLEVINPVIENPTPKNPNDVKLNGDGQLLMGEVGKEENVLTSDFYSGGYKLDYEVTVLDANHLALKVKVIASGEEIPVYSTNKVLKTLNLNSVENDDENIKAIEVTSGNYNETYNNPVISYDDEKIINTTYDPLTLKARMVKTYENLILKREKELVDYETITGKSVLKTNYTSNDLISSYVAQFYYKGKPYLSPGASWKDIYDFWPDLPKFDDAIIENTDKKANAIAKKYNVTQKQDLSKYLETNEGHLKVRAYIAFNNNSFKNKDMRSSCFVYVSHSNTSPWATRLVYCDEPGKSGWYYLALRKDKTTGNWTSINDNVGVENRLWSSDDDVTNPTLEIKKVPLYDEIMGDGEGIWVRVE